MQPPTFKGEGKEVERDAEVWLEAMDDYFMAAETSASNSAMLAMFRLSGEAKLWWKQHCRDSGVTENSQSWEQIKQAIKERYLPPAHQAIKMNEFYALKQNSLTLEEYYSKFVTLRRYAPQMTSEQQIARFCQGLNAPLDSRLEAMRPTSIQDALIRARPLAKESSFKPRQFFQKTRTGWNSNPPKPNPNASATNRPHNYAATEVMEFPNVRCYECHEMGHYRNKCPKRVNRAAAIAPPSIQEDRGVRGGGRGRGRGRGRVARIYGRPRGRAAHARATPAEPTLADNANERAMLHAAIDNPGVQNQYAVIQTPANHQGEPFQRLIDCGSTHSFLSPKCLRRLKLNQYPVNPMTVEMANGKEVISCTAIGSLEFELGGKPTNAYFRTLPVGMYDGILGMDWLTTNQASINCAEGSFTFVDLSGEKTLVQGKNGKSKACLVKANRLLKGLKRGQQIYVVKLNKINDIGENVEPKWISEFSDVFPEELIGLPPTREIDHDIEILPGSEPINKRPYKLSLPEAIELKEQLLARAYLPKQFTLGCTSTFSKEEGWVLTLMY